MVIAAVIIGGASILGGRGRVLGSCLGAILVVLIDKVLREGWPITRTIKIGDEEIAVNAVYTLPVGAVPVFLGLSWSLAVLIEPWLIRRQVAARLLGLAARQAAAARLRDRRRRDRRGADQGRDGDRHGADRDRHGQVPRPTRRAGHHPGGAALADRARAPAGLLVEPLQHLRDPAQLHRARADHRRPHLRDRRRRHRPLGRRGAGARRLDRGLLPQGARRRPDDRGGDGRWSPACAPGCSTPSSPSASSCRPSSPPSACSTSPAGSPPGSSPASSSPAGPSATT